MSALAQPGSRVYIASRSRAKGEAAVAQIRAATGSDAVFFLPLDGYPNRFTQFLDVLVIP